MEKPIIRNYKDILDYPNYVEEIDPQKRPLLRIITSYYSNEEFPCGLKGCHQPHKDGYLVELVDKGVTNVGWKCGDDFGEKFATEKRIHADKDSQTASYRHHPRENIAS